MPTDPYALYPMPYARLSSVHLMLLRKAIPAISRVRGLSNEHKILHFLSE